VSTAFDAHVTDQTLTGSAGDRSATRRQLRELAAACAIDDNDDVKCLDEITGVVPSSPNRSRHARGTDELPV